MSYGISEYTNSQNLIYDVKRILLGKESLARVAARLTLIQEIKEKAMYLGIKEMHLLNISTMAMSDLLRDESLNLNIITDYDMKNIMVKAFNESLIKYIEAHGDSLPPTAIDWYRSQQLSLMSQMDYKLKKITMKYPSNIPALEDKSKKGTMIICTHKKCGLAGKPTVRSFTKDGKTVYTEGIWHYKGVNSSNLYHITRSDLTEKEFIDLGEKYGSQARVRKKSGEKK